MGLYSRTRTESSKKLTPAKMGVCQKDGPFLRSANTRCCSILRSQKNDHKFDNYHISSSLHVPTFRSFLQAVFIIGVRLIQGSRLRIWLSKFLPPGCS